MARKWYHLVNADGSQWTSQAFVDVDKENVDTLRKAVKLKYQHGLRVYASDLVVYKDRSAFEAAQPLRSDASIALFGKSMAEALVIVVPLARTTIVMPMAVPTTSKPRWKAVQESSSVLAMDRLSLVDYREAVKDLCEAHAGAYYGAKDGVRARAWPIPVVNDAAFARHYIQRCREQWPTDRGGRGFQQSLTACQTLELVVEQGAFADAAEWCVREGRLLLCELDRILNTALVAAVMAHLDLSDGAPLPAYLTLPQVSRSTRPLRPIVRDLGPMFVVLSNIGHGVQYSRPDTEYESCDLFFELCSRVLNSWLNTEGVYFVVVADTPVLRELPHGTAVSGLHQIVRPRGQ